MNRFKKSIACALSVLFAGVFFAGCALFRPDTQYIENQIVARIGDDTNIKWRQLRDAYQNFGFRFVTEQNMTQEEAVNATLDVLIDREILAYLSMREYGRHGHGTHPEWLRGQGVNIAGALTRHEYELARRNVMNNFTNNIRSVERTIREDRNQPIPGTQQTDDSASAIYEPFHPPVVVTGTGGARTFELSLRAFETAPALGDVMTLDQFMASSSHTANVTLERAFQPRNSSQLEVNIMRDTRARIVRNLTNLERDLTFEMDRNATPWQRESNAIRRELDRMLLEEQKTLLVQRFNDMFNMGVMGAGTHWLRDDDGEIIDDADHPTYFELFRDRFNVDADGGDSNLTLWRDAVKARNSINVMSMVDRVRNEYMRNVRMSIDAFNKGITDMELIANTMLGDLSTVWWAPREVVDDFFTVSHILLGFSDAQQAELEHLTRRLNNREITRIQYDNEVQRIRGELRVRERNAEGIEEGTALSAQDALNQIIGYVGLGPNAQASFRNMIYAFNSDPGMENPTFEYVIGVDRRPTDLDGNRLGEDTMSRMVPEFTEESRRLQETFAPGTMSDRLVWTQFGAHIIMYTREVSTFINWHDITRLNIEYANFLYAPQTSYSNRTFFDSILESITRNDYGRAEDAMIRTFKQELGNDSITIYDRRFRDLWT
ncbi:MAG: hypothetical protein FWE38_05450 [Firmicutes bacterium]|nr:hypothetical protein [Bacillota bacterium]